MNVKVNVNEAVNGTHGFSWERKMRWAMNQGICEGGKRKDRNENSRDFRP